MKNFKILYGGGKSTRFNIYKRLCLFFNNEERRIEHLINYFLLNSQGCGIDG